MVKGEFVSPNINEIRMVMDRMRSDIGIPSMLGARNKFAQTLEKQWSVDESQSPHGLPDDVTGSLLRRGDMLTVWKMPELIMVYHKHTTQDRIPASPQDFFSSLEQASYGSFRFGGLDRSEMIPAQQFLDQATEALGGKTPALWLFSEALDILLKGLGLTDPNKMARALSEWKDTQFSKAIKEGLTMSALLTQVMRAYFHPGTMDILKELIKKEDSVFISRGVDLPSVLDELS